MSHLINWFEIPVIHFERAASFYGSLFGCKIQKTEIGEHLMGFFPMEQGSISGALVCGRGYEPCDRGTLLYFNGGSDLAPMLALVEPSGGKVLVPKTLISPETGYFALFLDTEGNKLALHSLPGDSA